VQLNAMPRRRTPALASGTTSAAGRDGDGIIRHMPRTRDRSRSRIAATPATADAATGMPELPDLSAVEQVDTRFLQSLLGYNARRAALAIIERFLARMAQFNLRPVEFSVMSVIHHNPGVTSRQLCAALNLLPPNLVGLIQALDARGLLMRLPHPHDGRAVGLHPTPAGTALMQQAEQAALEIENPKSLGLTPAQHKTLLDLLQKVYL
jgi:DNA-binding MarR family transcriptional regulator